MAGQGGRKDGQDKAGGGPAAPAPLTGSVGARALPVPGLCPLPARPAPATSGPAPSPAPARRRRRRRCREWQPPVLPAPPRRQSPGPARSPGQRGHGGKDSSTLLCPPCPSSVPPLSLLSPRVSTRCPLQGGSVGSANRRLRLRAAERRFLCLGVFCFFFVGLVGEVVFPPHFGVCKSSCCKLPVQKPASSTGRAKVLLVWFFSPSRSESAC